MTQKYSMQARHLVMLSLLMVAFTALPVSAAKLVDQNLCVLQNMANTSSSVARMHINSACNFLSLHEASLILNKDQRALSECVLKFLPGVESDSNATQLAQSCQQLVWDGVKLP